ncbi:MAG: hypothetical protein ACD_58C00042G0002 [uncultured bacterium]|nr:MAG: hypothetical protein ACD_58C00042G0002 [uncultured bacterium]
MSNFREIKEKFSKLPKTEQEKMLGDIYNFSADMKLFLENRFNKGKHDQEFIRRMKRETVDKVYKDGIPSEPNGKIINSIISKAKKSQVSSETLMELEKLAYRGFIEFLNEYGGGPDSFEEMGCNHLENYLKLVKTKIRDKEKRDKIFEDERKYLRKLDNMITDWLDQTFEDVTDIYYKKGDGSLLT